ncbi:MAG: AAA family ATPase, partial [Halothiobacillaceae bacterium]
MTDIDYDRLRQAMLDSGIQPPDTLPDLSPGHVVRYSTNGKPRDRAGWAVLYPDRRGAAYGCWRSGVQGQVFFGSAGGLSPAQRQTQRQQADAARRLAARQRHAEQQRATAAARQAWASASPAPADHPYLQRKGLSDPYGARVDSQGNLLIPIGNADGDLISLQRIAPHPAEAGPGKRYWPGAPVRGGHYWLRPPEQAERDAPMLMAEGYATAASIADAIPEWAVCCCFSCGNIKPTAEALRSSRADARLIIAGDDDRQTRGNPGRTHATEAARLVGGLALFPPVDTGSDWNDYAQAHGLQAVRQQLRDAAERALSAVVVSRPGDGHDGCDLSVRTVRGSEIEPEPVKWLWPGWLARGKLHILAGQAGTGKTTIACGLAGPITTGGQWPDGTQAPRGSVIIWSGEDDPADTLVPRLLASGADLERVHFVTGMLESGDERPFDPATDLIFLADAVDRAGDVKLIVMDPIVSAVAADSHKNGEVRRALQPVVD